MVPVPFDPDTVWGTQQTNRVTGAVNEMDLRASVDARQAVPSLIADVIQSCAEAGIVRSDVAADELANFCVHDLGATCEAASRPSVLD